MDEPTQPAEPTAEAKRSRGFAGSFVWGFGIVVLYFLSAGPVWFMESKGTRLHGIVWRIYAPWDWAYLNTPLHKPLGLYMHLWRPGLYDRSGNLVFE